MFKTPYFVLLVHAGATLALAGIIWFVQIVHYPLFPRLQSGAFESFQAESMRRTGWVVAPLLAVETVSALFLLWRRPPGLPLPLAVAGLSLVVVNWLSTLFLQMRQHRALSKGFNHYAYRDLVATNWIRTLTWTARGAVVLWMISLTAN
jgi:hypothetical protein